MRHGPRASPAQHTCVGLWFEGQRTFHVFSSHVKGAHIVEGTYFGMSGEPGYGEVRRKPPTTHSGLLHSYLYLLSLDCC